MSRGEIVSEIGAGRYVVKVTADNEALTGQITALNALVVELQAKLVEQQAELADKETALNTALTALTAAIVAFQAMPPEDKDTSAVVAAEKEAIDARFDYDEVASGIDLTKARIESYKTQITTLTAYKIADRSLPIWCADYTEELTGEVGLLDVNGDPATAQAEFLIEPMNKETTGSYEACVDGRTLPPLAVGVYTNWCVWAEFPAWQKYKPTYRKGTITAVDTDADTCSVTLDTVASREQNLDINVTTTLTDVPIEYMTCNSAVFEEDDRVIVDLTAGWDSPKVIGFVNNPKDCNIYELNGYVRRSDNITIGTIAQDVNGVYAGLGDRPAADPSKFRVTINGDSIPYYGLWGSAGSDWWSAEWYWESGGHEKAHVVILRGTADAASTGGTPTCEEKTMVLFTRSEFGGGLPAQMTLLLEENVGGIWKERINVVVDTNPNVTISPDATVYQCVSNQYDGSAWTFTYAAGTKVVNRNPTECPHIVVVDP